MRASTRIITNTLASYARLIFLALSGVLVTPVALHILGPSDYGIFSVIGGSLAFLMFINVALTTGAQRHIAYAIGEKNEKDVTKWFTASVIVHSFLGITIAVVALSCGHWVIFHLLTIPVARRLVAIWIYRMVVLTMVCNIVTTPYQALLMAHESIAAVSLLNILSAMLMIIGVVLLRFMRGDSLLWYGIIYCFSQMLLFIGPAVYCLYRYNEGRRLSRAGLNRNSIFQLLSFSGWNLFGALAAVIRSQGPALLLNIYLGPVANAAYGLAIQVNGFASEVSWGVLRATSPAIVKRRAAGDLNGMASLSNLANIYALVILWIVIGPVLFEITFCLKLWLHHVPLNTAAFVSLLLAALLIDQLTAGFGASLQATGRIAMYQMVVGSLNCIAVPIGWVMLRLGMPAIAILLAGIAGSILAGTARLWFASCMAGISVPSWLRDVLSPAAICLLGSSATMIIVKHGLKVGLIRFVLVWAVNAIAVSAIMWKFGMTPDHRSKLRDLISSAPYLFYKRFLPQQAP